MGAEHKPKWETQQVGGGWVQDVGRTVKSGIKNTASVVGDIAHVVPAVLKAKKQLGLGRPKTRGRGRGRKTQKGGWGFNVGPLGVNF